jgi:outer membrane protein OmpA-like peptidoglycan-associated protein/tetratricopeptide (TPR) repeat protein
MKILISTIFISIAVSTFAQTTRQLKQANKLLEAQKYTEATSAWKAIQAENPRNANFNFKLGLCYYRSFDKGYKSLEYFKKAVKKTSTTYDFYNLKEVNVPLDAWFFLGEAYMLNNKPDSALQNYITYLKQVGVNATLPVEQRITDCMKATSLMSQQNKKQDLKSLATVNSFDAETNPIVSWDESSMFFSARSLRPDNSNKNVLESSGIYFQDIYVSHFKNDAWNQPELLNISLKGNKIPLFISRNGNTLYFSNNDGSDYNIYSSEFKGDKWSEPVKLSFNSNADETGFTMSLDERKVWFSSNRKGGKGGFDIYSCEKNGTDWSNPVNIFELNTFSDELNPFVNPDGKTLFYSSNGNLENRMGGFDMYFSKLSPANKWSKPINMGCPINTTADDLFFSRSASDILVYMSRIETGKSFDIFQLSGFDLNDYNKPDESLVEELTGNTNDITDPDVKDVINQINKQNNEPDAIKLIEGLEPFKAAMVLNNIEKEMALRIMDALSPSIAAAIMGYMNIEKAIEITQGLPVEKASPILQLLNIEKSIGVMNGIDTKKASMIAERLETGKAVKVMEGLTANTSSSIINNMDISKAVGVMDGIDVQKAADIMEGVEIEKAIGVIEQMSTEKGGNIVAGIEVGKATSMMEGMNIEKAVGIMEGMPVEKAVGVMESFDKSKSVAVVSAMDNQKAANVLEKMDLSKAVAVMEGIPQEKAVGFIQGMEVEKAVDVMAGMNSEKSTAIVEDLQKQVDNEGSSGKVVSLLKKYFAGQISNKESILFKTIYFDFNSSELLLLSKNELLMLVDFMHENKIVKIEVVGHTDKIGDWDSNLKISGDRAKVVYDFLRNSKVEHDRIIFYGKGPAAPIATNETDYGRKMNRRVEVILLQ